MRPNNRQNAAADNLIRYFKDRAKKGYPESRRDWLYGPAQIPPGAWDQEAMLDDVIRRAKDRGAEDGFELVYVYWRPPVWTCRPSAKVRDKAQQMELKREASAQRRWERGSPTGSHNETLADWNATHLESGIRMLKVPDEAPAKDPVIKRIDAIPGLAN